MRFTLPRFALIVAMAASLAGCVETALADMAAGALSDAVASSTPASTDSAVAQVEDQVIFRGAQALTSAALAYESVAILISAGVDVGLIHGQTAATIQTYNRAVLEALERGERATTDADKARYAARAWNAINSINALPIIAQVRQLLRSRNQADAAAEAEAQPAAFVPVT